MGSWIIALVCPLKEFLTGFLGALVKGCGMEFTWSYTKEQPVPLSGTEKPRPTLLSATSEKISIYPGHIWLGGIFLSHMSLILRFGALHHCHLKKIQLLYMSSPSILVTMGQDSEEIQVRLLVFLPYQDTEGTEFHRPTKHPKTQIRFIWTNLLKHIHPSKYWHILFLNNVGNTFEIS